MITKILLDRLLKPDHFLRASSQAGPYIGQPVSNPSNTGQMRPVSSGDENGEINTFTYNGSATENGTQYALVDSNLQAFGQNMFEGATVTLTSGASAGYSRTIVNHSPTGVLDWSIAVAATSSGDSYTLTLDHRNRQFTVQLITGGDTGDADFIWRHDYIYYGRENPVTDSWKAGTTICSDFYNYKFSVGPTPPSVYAVGIPILQAFNGNLVVPYCRDASSPYLVEISSDNGLSWSTVNTGFNNSLRSVYDGIVLKSGRIIVIAGDVSINFVPTSDGYSTYMYSDDNGLTWKIRNTYAGDYPPYITKIIELLNGNLLALDIGDADGTVFSVRSSEDGGIYWSNFINVVSSTSNAFGCDLIQTNDNILCVYHSQEVDPGTTYSIRGIYSSDNGATWSGATTIATGNHNLTFPSLAKDINGDIFCAFVEEFTGAGSSIVFMTSPDNGTSWGSSRLLASNENHSLQHPFLGNINGHEIVCSYIDDIVGTTSAVFCRAGRASNYYIGGVSAIPCAPDLIKHRLVNDTAIQWYGGDGISGDSWTFTPKYQHAVENIIENNTNKVWRSAADSATCELIIDMGANNAFFADSVALFNCNFNSCSIQINSTDSWGSPSIDQSFFFTAQTGSVDSVTQQYIIDSSLVSQYSPHELGDGNHRLVLTSGASSGSAFLISDNVSNSLVIDTTAAHGIASADSFYVYGNKKYYSFTPDGFYRYIRVYIPAQETPEGYYQIGTMIIGNTITFTNTFADDGYSRQTDYNTDFLKSLSGTMNPIVYNDRKQKWSVSWKASKDSRKEMQAIATYARGKNMAFIPDWFVPSGGSKSSTTDVYLVKQVGAIRENFRYKNRWDLSVDFEENI